MGEKSRNAFAWSVLIIPISLPFGEDNEMLSVPITTLLVLCVCVCKPDTFLHNLDEEKY